MSIKEVTKYTRSEKKEYIWMTLLVYWKAITDPKVWGRGLVIIFSILTKTYSQIKHII